LCTDRAGDADRRQWLRTAAQNEGTEL